MAWGLKALGFTESMLTGETKHSFLQLLRAVASMNSHSPGAAEHTLALLTHLSSLLLNGLPPDDEVNRYVERVAQWAQRKGVLDAVCNELHSGGVPAHTVSAFHSAGRAPPLLYWVRPYPFFQIGLPQYGYGTFAFESPSTTTSPSIPQRSPPHPLVRPESPPLPRCPAACSPLPRRVADTRCAVRASILNARRRTKPWLGFPPCLSTPALARRSRLAQPQRPRGGNTQGIS